MERRFSATTQERDAALAKMRILESKIQDVTIDKGKGCGISVREVGYRSGRWDNGQGSGITLRDEEYGCGTTARVSIRDEG